MTLATDLAIRKWKPTKDGEAVGTGGRSGLYVRGWKTGTKAFYFRAKTWIKLGDYPNTSLAQARELSLVAKRLAKEGFGVDALRRGFANANTAIELEALVRGEMLAGLAASGVTKAPTYHALWTEWYEGRKHTLQEGPSRDRPPSIHRLHIKPILGDRPISEIKRREIFDLLEPLFREIPVSAGHALGHIRAVFDRAANKELIDADPVPKKSAFADLTADRQVKHHGTLPSERMPELWQWLGTTDASDTTKLTILMAMTTGHRAGVIASARWTHIDETSGEWTVPARSDKQTEGLMKSGREYSLCLPEPLLDQLRNLRKRPDQEYIFESPTTAGHISTNAMLKILKRFDANLTTHGFRNSVKTWCMTATPTVPEYVADAFCDHSLLGLNASYRRIETAQQRAELAVRLYNFVTGAEA